MVKPGISFIKRKIRKVAEYFRIERFSKPALDELDIKLGDYLKKNEGFFIEAGANDGFRQSNTYYLEIFKEWTGILIEPITHKYQRCIKERKRSLVINCALVSNDYQGESITMIYSDLMSLVENSNPSDLNADEHAERGILAQDNVKYKYRFDVPVRTLEEILIEINVSQIDFLSLDVEGYELEVLAGTNLNRFRPEFILIEARNSQEIIRYLEKYDYEMIEFLTHHDILFQDYRKKALDL